MPVLDDAEQQNHEYDVFLVLLSIVLPPVGVFLQFGFGLVFVLNLLLTLFGYVPGIIHALYLVWTR